MCACLIWISHIYHRHKLLFLFFFDKDYKASFEI